jgi:hypothetical protein
MGFYGYLQKKLDGFTQRITTKIKEYAHLGIVFKENDKSPHIYIYIYASYQVLPASQDPSALQPIAGLGCTPKPLV